MTDLAAATSLTRTDAVIRSIGKATKRMRELEVAEASAFAEYAAAQAAARAEGLAFDLALAPGLAASFSAWKQGKAAEEAREIQRSDWHEPQSLAARRP